MEYYDITNIGDVSYYDIIEKPVRAMRMKLELLDHFENCIGSIEQDIDSSSAGSIVVNNEQGCQRSCSFTLINVDEKYTIDENNFFWFNRKFKLYLGLTDYKNTFWFTKGVFITSDASCDSTAHTVSINAVDKYAQLNGDLNVLQMDEMDTIFEIGTNIEECVKDILLLDMGNGFVLDPIEPIIDPDIAKQTLYREFTMSAGSYFGDFFTEIATCFGCDIFYDALGRLIITRVFNDDIPYWYAFKSPTHKFDRNIHGYISPNLSTQMKGVNKIIVSTDNTDCENATYTAINHNPRSPLCYDKIGARTLPENGGIITINAGDPTEGTVEKRCKDYAEYRMIKETCMALKVTFNTIPLLHLNRGDVIAITDPQFGLNGDGFIIDSITYPLDTGEISIEATNLKYLNTDIYIDSQYTEIREITYSVSYDLNSGVGYVGATLVSSSEETYTVDRGYNAETHEDKFVKENYEFTYWSDNDNNIYYPNSTYDNPHTNLRLKANWASTVDREFKMIVKDLPSRTVGSLSRTVSGYTADTVEKVIIGNSIYYLMGRGYNSGTLSPEQTVEGDFEICEYTTGGTYTTNLNTVFPNTYVDYIYSIHYPDIITELNLYNLQAASNAGYNYVYFPKNLTSLLTRNGTGTEVSTNLFYDMSDTQEIIFGNTDSPLTITAYSPSYSSSADNKKFIFNCPALEKVWFKNSVTITNLGNGQYECLKGIHANIIVDGDITISKSSIYSGFVNSYDGENSVVVHGAINTSTGGSFCAGTTSPLTSFECESINNSGAVFPGSTIKSVIVSGQVVNGSGCNLFGGALVSDIIKVGGLNNQGIFAMGTRGIEEIIIKGNLSQNTTTYSGTIVNCAAVKTVHVTGAISVTPQSSPNFISNNPLLTDLYLYSDDFTITDSTYINKLFIGNNANFKIHGIANGTVQALAQTLGITFVPLTQEEIEGVDDL